MIHLCFHFKRSATGLFFRENMSGNIFEDLRTFLHEKPIHLSGTAIPPMVMAAMSSLGMIDVMESGVSKVWFGRSR